jgi:hypothetical protein
LIKLAIVATLLSAKLE